MAKGCPLIYIGKPCDEWDKFRDSCVYMQNEGLGNYISMDEFLTAQDKDWLKDFYRYFTPPKGVYCECVMATAIRESINKFL